MKAYNSAGALLQTGGGGGGGGGGTFSGGFSTMGNTAGDTGVKTDRMVLVGSNNITLSGSTNGGSITISIVGAAGGGGGVAISAAGNSISTGTAVWSNSNNVSFGMAGSTITATASFSQSNQQMTLFATGNTTQSSTGTTNASSVIFRGAGIASVGITGGSIVVSAVQSNVAFSADASSTFLTLTFQDSNGISWSNNAGAIRVTHGLQFTSNTSAITSNALNTSASRVINIIAATNNTGGGTASLSSNVSFSAANGVTFYTSAGNAIVASYTVPTVTNSSMTVSDAATSGTLARLAFTNLNGITLSLSTGAGGSHTIVGSYTVPTVTNSSWTVSDSATSGTVARLAFTNLNGITLSLSTGAGGSHTIVGSHNALTSQSNQAFSAAGGSSAFQTLSFSDNAQASFTNNAGQLAITNVRMSWSATGNTTQSSTGTLNASSIILRGSNLVSVGISNGSIIVDANHAFSAAGGSSTFQTLSFSDNAQASWTNNAGQVAITNVRMSMSATGNTTQSSTGTMNASSMIFRGSGAASVGISNGSVIVDVQAGAAAITQSIGMSTQTAGGATAGTTGYATGDDILYHFVPGSNITMSQSINGASGTLSIYGGGGGGGAAIGVSNTGHTAGNTGTFSSGTIVFAGSSSLTLSQSTGGAGVHTIWLQPAMSQLTAGAGISLSTAGSTVSIINIGAGTGVTTGTGTGTVLSGTLSTNGLSIVLPVNVMTQFAPYGVMEANTGTGVSSHAPASWWWNVMTLQNPLTVSNIWAIKAISPGTGTSSNSSGSEAFSYSHGITFFKRQDTGANSTNLTTVTTASFGLTMARNHTSNSNSVSLSYVTNTTGGTSSFSTSSAGNNWSNFFTGQHLIAIPLVTSFSAGEYFMAHRHSSTSGTTNSNLTLLSVSNFAFSFQTGGSFYPGLGISTGSASSAMPVGIGFGVASAITSTTTFAASVISATSRDIWYVNFVNLPRT